MQANLAYHLPFNPISLVGSLGAVSHRFNLIYFNLILL